MRNKRTHIVLVLLFTMTGWHVMAQDKELKRKNFRSKTAYKICKRIVANVEMMIEAEDPHWHCIKDSLGRADSLLPGNARINYWLGRTELSCGFPGEAYQRIILADSLFDDSPVMLFFFLAKAALQTDRGNEAALYAKRFLEHAGWHTPDAYIENAKEFIPQASTSMALKKIKYEEEAVAVMPNGGKVPEILKQFTAINGPIELIMHKRALAPARCDSFVVERYLYKKNNGLWSAHKDVLPDDGPWPPLQYLESGKTLVPGDAILAQYMENPPGSGMHYFSADHNESMGGYDLFRAKQEHSGTSKVQNMGTVVNTGGDDYLVDIFREGTKAWMLVMTCYNKANCSYRLVRLSEAPDCLAGIENDSLRDAYYRQRLLELSHTGTGITDSMAREMLSAPPISPDRDETTKANTEKQEKSYYYSIQIASKQGRPLTEKELKKIYSGDKKITEFRENGYYKYRIGEFTSIEEADQYLEKSKIRSAYIRKFRKKG